MICLVLVAVTILIASDIGYTKASKIILFSFFLVEYLVVFIVYLVAFLLRTFTLVIYRLILWNIGLCCIVWASALISLVFHSKEQVDFITSLWVNSNINL